MELQGGKASVSGRRAIDMLVAYKAWANRVTFETVLSLPAGEAERKRPTRFASILHTLNHAFVVDDIFRAHLEGRPHGYRARNTEQPRPIGELWTAVREMDAWYVGLVQSLSEDRLCEAVPFEFVGGGRGVMTREEIVLHLVNHATYHRGFVGDMMYQIPVEPPANDLTVFVRDHWSQLEDDERSSRRT